MTIDQLAFDHEKKIHPEYFAAVVEGRKQFEVRVFDEPWAEGETLLLREWDPIKFKSFCQLLSVTEKPVEGEPKWETDRRKDANTRAYTGNSIAVRVGYIVKPGSWGLPENVIVFGIERLRRA